MIAANNQKLLLPSTADNHYFLAIRRYSCAGLYHAVTNRGLFSGFICSLKPRGWTFHVWIIVSSKPRGWMVFFLLCYHRYFLSPRYFLSLDFLSLCLDCTVYSTWNYKKGISIPLSLEFTMQHFEPPDQGVPWLVRSLKWRIQSRLRDRKRVVIS